MARTKSEVRAFLDSLVGGIPQHPAPYNTGANNLSGQCVTLIKVLMDFLGVPNPYAARGNAIDVDNTLLRQGIAQNGTGWLNIVVNRDMGFIDGVHYGHVWVDLAGEANYESNGNRALHTTKNTRPISQGQQIVNLDAYITEGVVIAMPTEQEVINQFNHFTGKPPDSQAQVAYYAKRPWNVLNDDLLIWNRDRRVELQAGIAALNATVKSLNDTIKKLVEADAGDDALIADLKKQSAEATKMAADLKKELEDKRASDVKAENGILDALRAFWRILNR